MKHLIGVRYSEDGSPELQLYAKDSREFSVLPLSKGMPLAYQLTPERYCVGYTEIDGEPHPCPFSTSLRSGSQCRYCQQDDARLPCLKCDGSVCLADASIRADCREQVLVVYLAGFASDIKAGVTGAHRVPLRWFEQGADFATALFRMTDGKEARRIETLLHRKGLRNALYGKQKIKRLVFSKEKTFPAFRLKAEQILEDPDFSLFPRASAVLEFFDFSSRYPSFKEIPLVTEALQGTVVGNKGSLLFLEQSRSIRVLEINRLIGKKIAGQGGLFF
ncbi:DUF2797 domain-containing protein [Candidatus Micrarchaeota archaeon]|nr:DUF2797 domain-containing protein [Candidatus Micrarchaeota archaeon]